MNKKFLLPLLAAVAVSLLFSGCYSQYQTSASRPGDHVGHGSFGGLGPSGHHGELHGNHYFHDKRWGSDNLHFPRPWSPRNAPEPGDIDGYTKTRDGIRDIAHDYADKHGYGPKHHGH